MAQGDAEKSWDLGTSCPSRRRLGSDSPVPAGLVTRSRLVFSNGSFPHRRNRPSSSCLSLPCGKRLRRRDSEFCTSGQGMLPVSVLPAIRRFQCRNAAVAPVRLNDLQTTRGQTMLPNAAKRWFRSLEPARPGEPRKQNEGECRARLGIHAVKRSSARENRGRKG
jgi:hypothetical protein